MRSLTLLAIFSSITGSISAAVPGVALEADQLERRDLQSFISELRDGITLDDIKQSVLPDFLNWDTDEAASNLGLNTNALRQLPVEFLNIPGYGNLTDKGWFVRIHGQAYKQAIPLSGAPSPISQSVIDSATNVFLPDFDVSELPPDQADNARNLTSAILSVPQSDLQLNFDIRIAEPQPPGSRFTDSTWKNSFAWPAKTDSRGEIDGWVGLYETQQGQLPSGASSDGIVRLEITTPQAPESGNASAYLVPTEGYTILSDIDDILRVTKIYLPKEGLLNTFARPFEPWLNMPEVFDEWSKQHPENPYHFHYLTTTPEPGTRRYMEFIYSTYPLGSFDTRPYNFTTWDQTFNIRRVLVYKILETFPQRKFVLIGDTTNNDVMSVYPDAMRQFPNVACILLRNTSATDPENKFPYNTKGFVGLDENKWMFFRTPDDIKGLDLLNGECRRRDVPQNVTGTWQNVWGISGESAGAGGAEVRWGLLLATMIGVVMLVSGL